MAEQLTPRQQSRQIEDVRGSGIYPATGPLPPGDAVVRTPGAFAHPEERRILKARGGSLRTAAFLAGRAIFGGYFVYNGVNHLMDRSTLAGYARTKGVPDPEAAVTASGLLILAGGLSILTGAWPRVGAGLVSVFLLGVSPQMHAFWREEDAQQRTNEMVNFTKNMALLGAAFLVAAQPEPWPWSLRLGSHRSLPAPA
jgi:putative oxidoreductase